MISLSVVVSKISRQNSECKTKYHCFCLSNEPVIMFNIFVLSSLLVLNLFLSQNLLFHFWKILHSIRAFMVMRRPVQEPLLFSKSAMFCLSDIVTEKQSFLNNRGSEILVYLSKNEIRLFIRPFTNSYVFFSVLQNSSNSLSSVLYAST